MVETSIEFLELLTVFLWSATKFLVGVGFAIGLNLGFTLSMLTGFLGGMTGVLAYSFFGERIKNAWRKIFPPKRRITRMRRYVVRLKNAGGLWLIAFLTPILLTVPLGTFAAVSIGYPWQRIIFSMGVAFAFWALLFFGLYEIIGFNIRDFIVNLF